MNKHEKAAIYRRAAELLVTGMPDGYYGCALDDAGQPNPGGGNNGVDSPLQHAINERFGDLRDGWWCGQGGNNENQALALCLMADMVEAGDA